MRQQQQEQGEMNNEEYDAEFDDPEAYDSRLFMSSVYQHRTTNENDDYAFLDEDILRDENVDDDVQESLQRNYRQQPFSLGARSKSAPTSDRRNPKEFKQNDQSQNAAAANAWRRRGKRSTNDDPRVDLNNADQRSTINSEFHIVYKRKDSDLDHQSDYRKLSLLTIVHYIYIYILCPHY